MWMFFMIVGVMMTGCSNTQETAGEVYAISQEDLGYALPKVGEAEIIRAEVKAGSKGSISVATTGSPNTEILLEAGRILEEQGYFLNIEVCEDYLIPNQLVVDGKVDCNYYQHEAFLERYNIEKQAGLIEMAKIHYEPLAIFSQKLEQLDKIGKGAKAAVPENPTALAQALWLLQAEGLLTLMSDADMNTVLDDIAENPYELELVTMKEDEIMGHLEDVDLAICHTGFALKEAVDAEHIMLAKEAKDSMMAEKLSQSIVVKEYPNENAEILINVLMSDKMQKFIKKAYQGSIETMSGKIPDIEETNVKAAIEESEENREEVGQ